MKNKFLLFILIQFGCVGFQFSQMVPGAEENIPFLITFGKDAANTYGDDDKKQTFFFSIPSSYTKPFYIRIFDPEIGGLHDENINGFDTKTKYSFFGGAGIYSNISGPDAADISESYAGDLLEEETFDSDSEYDGDWFQMGPFNPSEGEFSKNLDSYIFKLLADGIAGDDGNAYQYFLSTSSNNNSAIPGANAFTFEYSIRLHDTNREVSHLYPFVDSKVTSIQQHNYDLDDVCKVSIFTVKKLSEKATVSGDGDWKHSEHKVFDTERESCMDFQIINNYKGIAKNNNAVLYITNQYGEAMPFMAVPIGDFEYKTTINIK